MERLTIKNEHAARVLALALVALIVLFVVIAAGEVTAVHHQITAGWRRGG